jgi:transposase InsO family protein
LNLFSREISGVGSMPVRTVGVVDQRHRAVRAVLELGQAVDEVAVHHGVHADTLRRWIKRFLAEGLEGLRDRPRTPHRSPRRIPAEVEERIVVMRQDHPRWGPRRIRAELGREGCDAPASSTVGAALVRNGLMVPKARKKKPAPRRFVAPSPNSLWQLDAYEYVLADGTTVEVIDVLDDHARFLLAVSVVATVTAAAVWAVFEKAVSRFGLPQRVLTDNAAYFTGRAQGVVADFERRLWSLGVATSNGAPRHPQTQGKIERLRRTVRGWLADHEPIETAAELQELLEEFAEHYNFDRPHQGLNDQLPGDIYAATEPAVPDLDNPPSRSVIRTVGPNGEVRYAGWKIGVGSEWIGWDLEIIEQAAKIRIVYDAELIASFSAETPKGYIGNGRPRGGVRKQRRGAID